MECPIRVITAAMYDIKSTRGVEYDAWVVCRKGLCAWWNHTLERCSVQRGEYVVPEVQVGPETLPLPPEEEEDEVTKETVEGQEADGSDEGESTDD